MTKDSAPKEQDLVCSYPAAAADDKQAAERRRLEDILEDDEVLEALKSLGVQRPAQRSGRRDPRNGSVCAMPKRFGSKI